MSTRFSRYDQVPNSVNTGYEGTDVPEDIEVPQCSIEDVDRALFNLFDKDIPMYYSLNKQLTRIPVIFATGERFAILRRNKPLRDKSGALILPIVSIIRTGVVQADTGLAGNQAQPIVIRRRLSQKDPKYQTLLNNLGLQNQDDSPSKKHFVTRTDSGARFGSLPGTVASRGGTPVPSWNARTGRLLAPSLNKNIYEIITLPPSKYFKADYEVTFWTQYTQQMNNLLSMVMSSAQWYPNRGFRIETEKGYWFVATLDPAFAAQNNYDDFSDDERLIRYSFNISVPAYLVAPDFPGAPPAAKRFLSAPELSFDVLETHGSIVNVSVGGVPSGDPGSYVLSDLTNEGAASPASVIGGDPRAESLSDIDPSVPGGSTMIPGVPGSAGIFAGATSTIGGHRSGREPGTILRMVRDPFTGEEIETLVRITTSDQRKGETVYKQAIITDLGTL